MICVTMSAPLDPSFDQYGRCTLTCIVLTVAVTLQGKHFKQEVAWKSRKDLYQYPKEAYGAIINPYVNFNGGDFMLVLLHPTDINGFINAITSTAV